MEFREQFTDAKLANPVLGVILVIAFAVISSTVVGTLVIGSSDITQPDTPEASFEFEVGTTDVTVSNYSNSSRSNSTLTVKSVTIVHETGDVINSNNLEITVDGEPAYSTAGAGADGPGEELGRTFSGDVDPGTRTTIVAAVDNSDIAPGTSIYITHGDGILDIDEQPDGTVDNTSVGLSSGQTISVVYHGPNSDKTKTLGSYRIP